MDKQVIILGGQGTGTIFASALLDAQARGATSYRFAGFLNDRMETGSELEGFPVLGPLDAWRDFDEHYVFINTILRIDGNMHRIQRVDALGIPDHRLATFVHPLAFVAHNVVLGPGVFIMPFAAISPSTQLGKGTLVMAGATIGHDNVVGAYCHFAAQSCVGSYLTIGTGVHIGLNATVREHLTIGDYGALGMGAVLVCDMGPGEIWAGNPARFLRRVDNGTD
jgi:acetyltransferase EpsM